MDNTNLLKYIYWLIEETEVPTRKSRLRSFASDPIGKMTVVLFLSTIALFALSAALHFFGHNWLSSLVMSVATGFIVGIFLAFFENARDKRIRRLDCASRRIVEADIDSRSNALITSLWNIAQSDHQSQAAVAAIAVDQVFDDADTRFLEEIAKRFSAQNKKPLNQWRADIERQRVELLSMESECGHKPQELLRDAYNLSKLLAKCDSTYGPLEQLIAQTTQTHIETGVDMAEELPSLIVQQREILTSILDISLSVDERDTDVFHVSPEENIAHYLDRTMNVVDDLNRGFGWRATSTLFSDALATRRLYYRWAWHLSASKTLLSERTVL